MYYIHCENRFMSIKKPKNIFSFFLNTFSSKFDRYNLKGAFVMKMFEEKKSYFGIILTKVKETIIYH